MRINPICNGRLAVQKTERNGDCNHALLPFAAGLHPLSRGLVAVAWGAQRLQVIERVCSAVGHRYDVIHFISWYCTAVSQAQHTKPAVTQQGSSSKFLPFRPVRVRTVLLHVAVP